MADEKAVGRVIHYYDKIGVAVVKLESSVKTGDTLKFVKDENEFTQTVSSMQFDHKPIDEGKKGQEVAIKIDSAAKEGTLVYVAE